MARYKTAERPAGSSGSDGLGPGHRVTPIPDLPLWFRTAPDPRGVLYGHEAAELPAGLEDRKARWLASYGYRHIQEYAKDRRLAGLPPSWAVSHAYTGYERPNGSKVAPTHDAPEGYRLDGIDVNGYPVFVPE